MFMKILAATIITVFLLSTAVSVFASGIGIWENKTGSNYWLVCREQKLAESIADLFYEVGFTVASDTWDAELKAGNCLAIQGEMFPQAVLYRRGEVRIVRVADRENKEFYWFTMSPVVGEPVT